MPEKFLNNFLNFIRPMIPKPIFKFFQPVYHWLLSFLAALIYRFPSRKIKVIGVTGTKGKSTAIYFLSRIFEETGHKIAALSSIQFKIGDKEWPNELKMTMPGRFQIQRFLRQAVNSGCQFVIIEVTSQGILQHRHRFINFDSAVFTNLSPEHLEAHAGFENYKNIKLAFFKYTKNNHILNKDDKYFEEFLKMPAKNKFSYSLVDAKGLKLRLVGDFNLINAAAAIRIAEIYGIAPETAKKILENIEIVPGRMEFIDQGQNFKVIIDYAHTPDSLFKVYETLLNINSQTSGVKLICVLGAAGGGRDKWKRPEMGKIAAQYCDEIILTNEDPYDESPLEIINQIEEGISVNQRSHQRQSVSIYKIIDRAEAIKKAIFLAKEGDIVIITGKGCEPWMMVENNKKIPWSDKEIAKKMLNN